MSEPCSSGVICSDEISTSSSTSLLVSLPDVSSQQDSAVEMLFPRPRDGADSERGYGTIATATADCTRDGDGEPDAKTLHCCSNKRQTARQLCLSLATIIVIGLFLVPVAYRTVSKNGGI